MKLYTPSELDDAPLRVALAIPDIRRRLLTLKQGRATRPLRRAAVRLALAGAVLFVAALGALKPVAAEQPAAEISLTADKLLSSPVSITTDRRMPLDRFMAALSHGAPAGMKFLIAGGAKAEVSGTFQNKPLREVLDAVLSPAGLAWSLGEQNLIVIYQKSAVPTVRFYKIDEQDGPRVKALVNSIIDASNDQEYVPERTLIVDKGDLVVRDTPDTIKKIEELLPSKKLIRKDLSPKLDIANFSLVPRDAQVSPEQVRVLSSRVLKTLKTFLDGSAGEAKDTTEGRRLWFDPGTLQLTILDTPDKLARVREYLSSLPELAGDKDLRQETVPLQYMAPEEMIRRLRAASVRIGPKKQEVLFKLRQGEDRQWCSVRIRVLRVRAPGPVSRDGGNLRQNEGLVEFTIDNGIQPEQRTMREFSAENIDDYRITVEDVGAQPGDTGAGSARFRITWLPKQAIVPLLEGIGVAAFEGPQGEGITIRYRIQDRARFKDILDRVRQLDVKPQDPAIVAFATTDRI